MEGRKTLTVDAYTGMEVRPEEFTDTVSRECGLQMGMSPWPLRLLGQYVPKTPEQDLLEPGTQDRSMSCLGLRATPSRASLQNLLGP